MNKLAPALAQCQGLSEPNLRDPKSCGPCADPWDMMPTNIVFICNEAMNKVFDVETGNQESADVAAEMIKEDPHVLQIVKNIKAISDFFEQCKGENWKPYDDGIIPYCLWKDASTAHKYSPSDLAFVSGIIDNLYGQYEGLKNVFSTVEQIHTSLKSATYDILQAYFKDCSPKTIKLNQQAYRILVNKLAEDSDQDNVWGWVKYQLDEKAIVEVKTDLIECENAKKLKTSINNLVDFITDYPKMAVSLGKIISRSEVYLKNLSKIDVNLNRYKHGKIVAEVVTLVTPVLISKVGKLRAIEEISVDVEKNLPKFEKELERLLESGVEVEYKLLEASKIEQITGLTATENSIVYTEGKKLIEEVANLSRKKTPGVGCILVKDTEFTSAFSNKTKLIQGELPESLHPLVYEWFSNPKVPNAPSLLKRGTHGKCAEPEAISQWLFRYEKKTKIKITSITDARDALKGSKIVAFDTTTKIEQETGNIIAKVGDVKPACLSCNPFLKYFGVDEIDVSVNINIK